jgi:hypothetical protein
MTFDRDTRTGRKATLVGMTLIAIGVLFLLRELGIVPDVSLWTLLWLAVGGFLLVATITGGRRGWFAPLAVFGIGVFMLLRDLGTIRRGFAVWPIVVIALGLAMLLDAGRSSDPDSPKVWR